MSGTYRRTTVYTKDGHYGLGNNARTAAAEMRKIDRRKMRREAGRIKRDAMREYEDDIADAQDELLQMAMEEEYGRFGDDWEGYDDPMPEPFDYCYENGYWDDYADYGQYDEPIDDASDYYYDRMSYGEAESYYAAGHLSREGITRLDLSAKVERVDVGKSLGEILAEALNRIDES